MAGNMASQSIEGMKHPEILILFPDDWAAYSPTLQRLVDQLRESSSVRVHAMDTGRFDNTALDPEIYRFVKIPARLGWISRKTGTYRLMRTLALVRAARHDSAQSTHIIAIDADGTFAAFLLRRKFHYLSLEVGRHFFLQYLAHKYALSITSQSRQRLNFQFNPRTIDGKPIFFIQNAPVIGRQVPRSLAISRTSHPRFVYLGNAIPLHGLYRMLELVNAWPEATLTLQGIIPATELRIIHAEYGHLLTQGRLIISNSYVPEGKIEHFLADFDIGLCLYELGMWNRRNFNYLSVPAGKMFNYFAAGLPVIASNLIGLSPVTEYQAGVQVTHNDVESLREAAQLILARYNQYSVACLKAAADYDFRSSAAALINFLHSGKTT